MPEISRRVFGGLVGGGAVSAVAGPATAAEAAPTVTERPFKARPTAGGRRPNLLVVLGDDLREQADLAPDGPELLAELKASWEKTASGLLPYPA
ncbi:hypothetical protein [Streptomyces sp. NPDC050263]|uniref:hypothetical protein n=1 Tax=Streptomyces sp. NPDC050263 TaxID=3155037 RepID=UPI0034376107